MKIGCVPTKYGYSAVALPGNYNGDWELDTPLQLPIDMLVQLRGQILHKLALYCHSIKPYACLKMVIFWGAWSALAFGLGIFRLWTIAPKYLVLYGWIRIFFFGDGLFMLARSLCHLKALVDVRRIREGAALGEWISTDVEMPLRTEGAANYQDRPRSEENYIKTMSAFYPVTAPYYDEMLREEPPWVFSAWPLGVIGWLRRMFVGPRTPRPVLVFELGELQ